MPTPANLTEKYEEERLRTQEQSQIVYLQGQIDELRQQIKDQNNKYQWSIEQARKTEGTIAQVQSTIERQAEEFSQIVDRSRRDVLDLRKEIANALVKIQESFEPIRQMQAQIQQLAESRKQDRDESYIWIARIDEIEQRLGTVFGPLKEAEERHRQLAMQLDSFREADSNAIQQIRRLSEDLQIEKQSLRRQAVEAQQLVTDVRSVLEEHDARIVRIDEIRQNIELFAETVPGQFVEINNKFPDIHAEIKRVERISTERFLMNQERMEVIRHQAEEQIGEIRETEEQHVQQHISWLERIDGWLHELEQRINQGFKRFEEAQRHQIALIEGLEEREPKTIAAISAVFQEQVESIKVGQLESRKGGGYIPRKET